MTLDILQLIFALLLIGAVLIQSKNANLGSVFGGNDNVQTARRGVERKIHITTIVIAVIFFAISLANVLY